MNLLQEGEKIGGKKNFAGCQPSNVDCLPVNQEGLPISIPYLPGWKLKALRLNTPGACVDITKCFQARHPLFASQSQGALSLVVRIPEVRRTAQHLYIEEYENNVRCFISVTQNGLLKVMITSPPGSPKVIESQLMVGHGRWVALVFNYKNNAGILEITHQILDEITIDESKLDQSKGDQLQSDEQKIIRIKNVVIPTRDKVKGIFLGTPKHFIREEDTPIGFFRGDIALAFFDHEDKPKKIFSYQPILKMITENPKNIQFHDYLSCEHQGTFCCLLSGTGTILKTNSYTISFTETSVMVNQTVVKVKKQQNQVFFLKFITTTDEDICYLDDELILPSTKKDWKKLQLFEDDWKGSIKKIRCYNYQTPKYLTQDLLYKSIEYRTRFTKSFQKITQDPNINITDWRTRTLDLLSSLSSIIGKNSDIGHWAFSIFPQEPVYFIQEGADWGKGHWFTWSEIGEPGSIKWNYHPKAGYGGSFATQITTLTGWALPYLAYDKQYKSEAASLLFIGIAVDFFTRLETSFPGLEYKSRNFLGTLMRNFLVPFSWLVSRRRSLLQYIPDVMLWHMMQFFITTVMPKEVGNSGDGNHGIDNKCNYLAMSLILSDCKSVGADTWFQDAFSWYANKFLNRNLMKDGTDVEQTIHYNMVMVSKGLFILKVCESSLTTEKNEERIEKLKIAIKRWTMAIKNRLRFAASLRTPLGGLPHFGVGGLDTMNSIPCEDFQDVLVNDLVNSNPNQNPSTPHFTHISFPYSGYQVIRSDWTSNAFYIFMKSSILGNKGIRECNSIEVYYNGLCVLRPFGCMQNLDDPKVNFAQLTQATCSLTLDDKTQIGDAIYQGNASNFQENPLPCIFYEGENYVVMQGKYFAGYGDLSENPKTQYVEGMHSRWIIWSPLLNLKDEQHFWIIDHIQVIPTTFPPIKQVNINYLFDNLVPSNLKPLPIENSDWNTFQAHLSSQSKSLQVYLSLKSTPKNSLSFQTFYNEVDSSFQGHPTRGIRLQERKKWRPGLDLIANWNLSNFQCHSRNNNNNINDQKGKSCGGPPKPKLYTRNLVVKEGEAKFNSTKEKNQFEWFITEVCLSKNGTFKGPMSVIQFPSCGKDSLLFSCPNIPGELNLSFTSSSYQLDGKKIDLPHPKSFQWIEGNRIGFSLKDEEKK